MFERMQKPIYNDHSLNKLTVTLALIHDAANKKTQASFEEAKGYFNLALIQLGHHSELYNTIIQAAIKCDNLDYAWTIYQAVCARNIDTIDTYLHMIRGCRNFMDHPRALFYADSAFRASFKNNKGCRQTFLEMIMTMDALNKIDYALKIFKDLEEIDKSKGKWLEADLHIYFSMITALGNHPDYVKSFELAHQIFQRGLSRVRKDPKHFKTDVLALYKVMMFTAAKCNRADYAVRCYDYLLTRSYEGIEPSPDIQIFLTAIAIGDAHNCMRLAYHAYNLAILKPEYQKNELLHIGMLKAALHQNDLVLSAYVSQKINQIFGVIPSKLTMVYENSKLKGLQTKNHLASVGCESKAETTKSKSLEQGRTLLLVKKIKEQIENAGKNLNMAMAIDAYMEALHHNIANRELDTLMIETAGLCGKLIWALLAFDIATKEHQSKSNIENLKTYAAMMIAVARASHGRLDLAKKYYKNHSTLIKSVSPEEYKPSLIFKMYEEAMLRENQAETTESSSWQPALWQPQKTVINLSPSSIASQLK